MQERALCRGDLQARGSDLCELGSESAGCFYSTLIIHAREMQPRGQWQREGAGLVELGLRGRHGADIGSHGAGQEAVLAACSCEHPFFTLQPVFHVMGFSVTGRVLDGPDGEGVPEAVVTLNNQIKGGQAQRS